MSSSFSELATAERSIDGSTVFAARDGFEFLVFLAANSSLRHSAFERAMSDAGDIELLAQRPPFHVPHFTFHVLGCHPAIRNGLGPSSCGQWSCGQLSVVARHELRL